MDKVGFFEENVGEKSHIRLSSFISLLASVGFGYMTIQTDSDFGLYITVMFLLGAFAPKVIQKFAETEALRVIGNKSK